MEAFICGEYNSSRAIEPNLPGEGEIMKCLCFVWIIAVLELSGGLQPVSAADESTDAAALAVQSWLALVDSGKYAESWDEAAQILKSQVTKDQWVTKLNSIRSPLGKLQSRVLNSSVPYSKSQPGAQESECLIIIYDAKFELSRSSNETVIPTKEKDGQWRISAYFVERR
jgi:hypothetical protein